MNLACHSERLCVDVEDSGCMSVDWELLDMVVVVMVAEEEEADADPLSRFILCSSKGARRMMDWESESLTPCGCVMSGECS